jgi:hypothetical protein
LLNENMANDMAHVLGWDIEAVPDLRGFTAANGLDGNSDDEIRAAMGDKLTSVIDRELDQQSVSATPRIYDPDCSHLSRSFP